MSVYELLTDRDKELITDYIAAFADQSNDITNEWRGLDVALAEWDKQKSKFLEKMFGEHLILSRPFTYKMPEDGLWKEYNRLRTENAEPLNNVTKWLRNLWATGKINDDIWVYLRTVIEGETLIANAYKGEDFIITGPEDVAPKKPLKISKGMKPMRILTAVAERLDPTYLEPDPYTRKSQLDDFMIWHSKIFNQSNIDGELCLSIHPLDFMTMSDNTNGWDSCMTWAREGNPGDYRAGTLECMNSPYLVVAYLHNPKHVMNQKTMKNHYSTVSDDWEWNSKRWRELFLVQDDIILEIKGYPYQDENLTNAALMWLKELAHDNLGWDYNDEEMNIQDDFDIDDENYYSITVEPTYHMYNDVGTIKVHRMRVNYDKLAKNCENEYDSSNPNHNFYNTCQHDYHDDRWHHIYTIPFGGIAKCMCCGKDIDYDEETSNNVLCSSCHPGYRCACCGEWINGEAYYVENEEDPICYYCWENNTITDDLDSTTYLDGDCNMVELRWAPIVDDDGNCALDEDGTPIFYDNTVWTYEPRYNNAYNAIFNKPPREYYQRNGYGWGGTNYYYVTTDMINDIDAFKEVFNIRRLTTIDDIVENIKNDYPEWFDLSVSDPA